MELEQVMQALRAADQRAQAGDQQAAADARRLAQIAQRLQSSAQPQRREPALSQVNLGIADAAGGLVDLLNPFDTPAVSQALGMGDRLTTGSAREGLVGGMQSIGAVGEDRPAEGVGEAFLRGSGQAAGAVIPAAGAARVLSTAPGMTGQVAGEISRGMATRGGVAAEIAAGGTSAAAMQATEQGLEGSDLPEWAQDMLVGAAGVAAPMGLAGATFAAQRAPSYMPGVVAGGRAVNMATAALAPYTRRGAEEVARRRMQELAGSRERAIELGERINPSDEFGLSPAQQTGDPRMLAVEQLATRQSPILAQRMEEQFASSMGAARGAVDDIGGDVGDAQRFIGERRAQYTTEMRAVADQALANAERRLGQIGANRTEGDNSLVVMEEISRARDVARAREAELWEAVPVVAQVGTGNARSVADGIVAETARARARDIPPVVRELLLDQDGGLGEATTVRELHGLYSELRQDARNSMAGTQTNPNRARIANAIADAILEDLGAIDATTTVGRSINDARAFSSALHQTFDQGAYGRLSRRTVEGDTAVDPELALERTVGRAGTTGDVSARQLETAGAGLTPGGGPARPNPAVGNAITDFVRGRFADRAFTPDANGNMVLNRRGAAQFISDNRVLLERYPELRGEILEAANQQQTADQVAQTIANRIGMLEDARRSPTAGFVDASQETAIRALVDAENPQRAAQLILNAARRDETGAALDGVKALFSDELIRRATRTQDGVTFLEADAMLQRLQDPRFSAAMRRVLDPGEIRRIEEVIRVVQRLNQSQVTQGSIGESLSGARAPRLIEFAIRIAGAQAANASPMAGGGGAGVSLQAAQMGSSAARDILGRLTADRASQLIADAIADPRLFQALLMDPASARFEAEALPRLVPYLIGAGAASVTPDE